MPKTAGARQIGLTLIPKLDALPTCPDVVSMCTARFALICQMMGIGLKKVEITENREIPLVEISVGYFA